MSRAFNESKGSLLAEEVRRANSVGSRMRGLLGQSGLPSGHGLFLKPSSAIHTFFMRFPIDVVFVGRDSRVVKVVPNMKPFRIVLAPGAQGVLELPAGAASRAQVERGDLLVISDD